MGEGEGTLTALAAERLLPDRWTSIFISGSLVRGWGNRRSDLDVYVITADPYREKAANARLVGLEPPRVPVESTYVEDRRWEVEYWHLDQLRQLLGKVSWEALRRPAAAGEDLTDSEVSFLDRLLIGVPVPGTEDDGWLREHQRLVGESALGPILVAKKLAKADNCQEDAVGQLADGDPRSATLSARAAFGATVDALLASHDRFTPVAKWRARQLLEVEPPELPFEDYWQVETMSEYDAEDPEAWIRTTLELCQDLQAEVVVA